MVKRPVFVHDPAILAHYRLILSVGHDEHCPARWAPGDSLWYDRFPKDRTGAAVVGVYTRGGTVITTGTTDSAHGLRGNDPAVVQITKNVLDRLSK